MDIGEKVGDLRENIPFAVHGYIPYNLVINLSLEMNKQITEEISTKIWLLERV